MPRLIDADTLTAKITVLIERNSKFIDKGLANLITDAVEETSTVDAEPVRHGRWYSVENYMHTSRTVYVCSECGKSSCRFNYCPNCGARMDESKEQSKGETKEREENGRYHNT